MKNKSMSIGNPMRCLHFILQKLIGGTDKCYGARVFPPGSKRCDALIITSRGWIFPPSYSARRFLANGVIDVMVDDTLSHSIFVQPFKVGIINDIIDSAKGVLLTQHPLNKILTKLLLHARFQRITKVSEIIEKDPSFLLVPVDKCLIRDAHRVKVTLLGMQVVPIRGSPYEYKDLIRYSPYIIKP